MKSSAKKKPSPPFEFDPATHTYKERGIIVPGVTRVLGHLSARVYRSVRADILERQSALGREVHRCTHLLDLGKLKPETMDEKVAPRVEAWRLFCREVGFVTRISEYRCLAAIDGMTYGLTCDAVGLVRGRYEAVVEKKCTRQIYPHHFVQTAGYAAGVPMGNIVLPASRFAGRIRFIVKLQANGRPDVKEAKDRSDYEAYRSMLYMHYWNLRYENFYGDEEPDSDE